MSIRSNSDYVVALDLGTTNVKAAAITSDLKVIGEVSIRVATESPNNLFHHQDPDEIVSASRSCLTTLTGNLPIENMKALIFSNAMHSLIAVDKKDRPLTKAMIWSDLRAGDIAKGLREKEIARKLYNETGTPIHPMSPLCKILWIRENQEDIFQNTHKYLSIKDYLVKHWFNTYLTDYSTASASGLFDINKLQWHDVALELAGINEQNLPEYVNIYQNLAINADSPFHQEFNFPADIPVLIGGTDGCLAVLGGGKSNDNSLSLTIGTSAAVRAAFADPVLDPGGRIFNYYFENEKYISGGPSNNGGNVLEWFENCFPLKEKHENTTAFWEHLLNNSTATAEGLIFLPYLFAERAPLWDPTAKGSFLGLSHFHNQVQFGRAVIEGILMNLKYITSLLEHNHFKKLIISGGAFKIPSLPQLTADIFNITVESFPFTNLSALGAAIVGWKYLGIEVDETSVEKYYFEPDPEQAEIYARHYFKFMELLNMSYNN